MVSIVSSSFSFVSEVIVICLSVSAFSEVEEVRCTSWMSEGGPCEGGVQLAEDGKWEWQVTDTSSFLFPQGFGLRDSTLSYPELQELS